MRFNPTLRLPTGGRYWLALGLASAAGQPALALFALPALGLVTSSRGASNEPEYGQCAW